MPVTGLAASASTGLMSRRDGKLKPASWAEAFAAIAAKVEHAPNKMAAIVGDLAAAEEIKALKDLMTALRVKNLDCRQDGAKISGGPRQTYLFNTGIAGVEAGGRHSAGRRQPALGSAGAQCPHPQDLAGVAA